MAGMLTVAAAIRQAGVVLSQPVVKTTPVQRVAMQDLDQPQIRQVAIQRCGRPFARLLDGVHGKFQRHPASVADTITHPAGQLEMVAVARRKIGTSLRDTDDGLARLQFLAREPIVHVALDIERRHARVGGVVEPPAAAQCGSIRFRCIHGRENPCHRNRAERAAVYGCEACALRCICVVECVVFSSAMRLPHSIAHRCAVLRVRAGCAVKGQRGFRVKPLLCFWRS